MVTSTININSIDVSAYVVSYECTKIYGDAISRSDLVLKRTVSDAVTITEGMTIDITRIWDDASDTIFNGWIESHNIEGGLIKITARDKLWDLVRKEVTHNYDSEVDVFAGRISAIFEDLVETYGGLTCTVQDSGTTNIIDKFICNHADILERCQALAIALDWQFYYEPNDDEVYFEPKGYTTNNNVLTVGTEIIEVPKWEKDATEMVNDLIVSGAYQEVETTASAVFSVGQTSILLDWEPISVKLWINDVLQVGGVPESTVTYDYWVDKKAHKIRKSDTATWQEDDPYVVNYSYAQPAPVHIVNSASVALYGQFKKTLVLTDVKNVADAEMRGREYLNRYSEPFDYATIKVNTKTGDSLGLKVGQMIRIVDNVSSPSVDKWYLINRVVMKYPYNYDEIYIGDKEWRMASWQGSVEIRLKRLLEDELVNQGIIVELISIENSDIIPLNFKPRYRKVIYQIDSGGLGPETDHWIGQYQNIYIEDFVDDDFKDADTTAAWGTGSIVF